MPDVVLAVAMAIDAGFGGRGQWDRLVVDAETQAHREDLKKVAHLAIRAVVDLDWPVLNAESSDATIGVVLSGEVVRSFVRQTLQPATGS